eukprot:TRINITY_DN27713_c0_g1_i1.p1 TRINITY_DN27713_c0_g1~~TRINITY_DN27713_c0_g1_i1.p1  ORF type:complete len:131 (+),score=5.30 TRINITY_DN27713_c0_g1_i1:296-688(+)
MHCPVRLIHLIMACVVDPQYSILVNGQAAGYFRSTRGLRQGCPLSPFLFTIVMEYFSSTLNSFATFLMIPSPYHRSNVTVSHLLFADDVMVFSKAAYEAAQNLRIGGFSENFGPWCKSGQKYDFFLKLQN